MDFYPFPFLHPRLEGNSNLETQENSLHPISKADMVNNIIYNWGLNSTYGDVPPCLIKIKNACFFVNLGIA